MRRVGFTVGILASVMLLHATAAYSQSHITWYLYWYSGNHRQYASIASVGYDLDGPDVLVFSRISDDDQRRITYLRELYDCAGKRVAVSVRREVDLETMTWTLRDESANPMADLKGIAADSREALVFAGVCSPERVARPWKEVEDHFAEISKALEPAATPP